ncbi:HigA family addiction module antidote protein [Candidatus Nomurabacteria bacterium]|nr:HigA family addiction module antidote protein [Candidatus Nomurabacteria bacterium]
MEAKEYVPFEATHPGSLIKDELKYRGISQKEFARDIDMQPSMLNELIKEKRAITAEIALALEKGLGIPADFWMRHQAGYELDCARIKERNIQKAQQIELWSLIKKYVPVSIFTKLGILFNSQADSISKILEIYYVQNVNQLIESVTSNKKLAFYKKSEKLINDHTNIFAWSKLAQWLAKSEKAETFRAENKELLISELNELFYRNNNVLEGTRKILTQYGVKFLILEKFKQSPIDGFSFWSENNPAIVVTLRKKQLDNFAFTIMHELGHVFEHLLPNHDAAFLDIEFPVGEQNEQEEQAHKFARNSFIPEPIWKGFFRQNPQYDFHSTDLQIQLLAKRLNVHPSIIFGRYCFESGQFAIRTSIDRSIH